MANLSFDVLCSRFLAHLEIRSAAKTVAFYRDCTRVLRTLPGLDEHGAATPPLGARAALDLGQRELDAFVRAARAEPLTYAGGVVRHREVGTINAYLRTLKALLRWGADGNGLARVPVRVRFLPPVRRLPVLFSTVELDRLMLAAAPRERLLVLLLGASAERVNEILHTQVGDVSWLPDGLAEIRVTAKPEAAWRPKTHQERSIFLPPGVARELAAYVAQLRAEGRGEPTDWLFQVSPRLARVRPSRARKVPAGRRPARWANPYPKMRAVFRRAGLYTRGRLHHLLRKAAATAWLRAGVDVKTVSEMLGHADVATTLRHYVIADDDSKKAAALRGLAG